MITKVAIIEDADVSMDDITPYGRNPRRGSIQAIAESLEENAQYRPIVVNKRDMVILAGNHTYLAAQRLGWDTIRVAFVDVDEVQAKKIMLADNRTNDLATYDPTILAEILESIPSPVGTGYTEDDVSGILSSVLSEDRSDDRLATLLRPSFVFDDVPDSTDDAEERTAGTKVAGITRPAPEDDEEIRSLDDVSSDLEGILELKEDVIFPLVNYWGIPELKRDKLLTPDEIPPNLDTWAGKDVTPDDGMSWWFYNYGVDSASGLPWDRTILSFYTHDFHFENWWRLPAHYTAKCINAGLGVAVSPNYSLFMDDPRVIQLWNVYRSRWMGRYFQEAGMKVIPDVGFPDEESANYAMEGIPKNPPVISMQFQSIKPHEKEAISESLKNAQLALDHLKPECLIAYGSKTGHDIVDRLKTDANIIKLMNRAHKRRGVAFDASKGYDITKDQRRKSDAPHDYGTQLGRHQG